MWNLSSRISQKLIPHSFVPHSFTPHSSVEKLQENAVEKS